MVERSGALDQRHDAQSLDQRTQGAKGVDLARWVQTRGRGVVKRVMGFARAEPFARARVATLGNSFADDAEKVRSMELPGTRSQALVSRAHRGGQHGGNVRVA
jgi:hypothetical protein